METIFKPFDSIEQLLEYYPIGTVINVSSKQDNTTVTGIIISYSHEEDSDFITVGNRSFEIADLCANWLINGKPVGQEYRLVKEEPKKEKKEEGYKPRKSIPDFYQFLKDNGLSLDDIGIKF